MGRLKMHSDRIALLFAAIILIATCFYVVREGFFFREKRHPSQTPQLSQNIFKPLSALSAIEAQSSFQTPPLWERKDNPLFVSRMYILKDGQLIDPIETKEPIFPPIPNSWIFQYNLDVEAPDLLNADSDGDSFSNLEEWEAKTDPTDKLSHPEYWTKLRFESYRIPPFQVKFSGSPDGGKVFTINPVNNPNARTQFLKLGETLNINGTLYTLINYKERYVGEGGVNKNASELVLQNQKTQATVILIYDQVVNSPIPYATFKDLVTGQVFDVKEGDSFILPEEPNITYTLINLSPTNAQIQSSADKEVHDIEIYQPKQ